jgi:hypothetical protein
MQDYDATYLVRKHPNVSTTILIDQVQDHVIFIILLLFNRERYNKSEWQL